MPIRRSGPELVWSRRDRLGSLLVWSGWLFAVLVVVAGWQFIAERTLWIFVLDAPGQAGDLLSRLVPPRWSYMEQLWWPLWETINIATLGTLLALVVAVPTAFLAARNTTPSITLVRPLALLVIVASRSINAIIWALVLVTLLGPGPLAGILAIALRSVGFIGKLLYEAIEEIDPLPVEAITATGAGRGQVLVYGIVPQVLPAFAGITVYRWDINIRESTVVGLVGAGGIGLQLIASVNSLAWQQVSLILLLILVTVVVSEWVSARVRQAVT